MEGDWSFEQRKRETLRFIQVFEVSRKVRTKYGWPVTQAVSLSPYRVRPIFYNAMLKAGGQRLKKSILNKGKVYLHCHPGSLPAYRGSTVYYYALLNRDAIGCSVIAMTEQLDHGPVLHHSEFTLVPTLDADWPPRVS